jgi:hypothetical protein
MSITRIRRFSISICAVTSIAIFAFCVPIVGHAADKPAYMTATAAEVQAQIGLSRKLGEMDGDTYYFKPAGGNRDRSDISSIEQRPNQVCFCWHDFQQPVHDFDRRALTRLKESRLLRRSYSSSRWTRRLPIADMTNCDRPLVMSPTQ